MKCPKCGYTSFPHLESCRKCGHGLAEVREFFGVYALPPNPPDLMLAYEALQTDAMETTVAEVMPAVDLEQLEEIDLDLANAADAAASPAEEPELAELSRDIVPTFDRDPEPGSPLSSPASTVERPDDKEPIVLDLSDLEGLTIELREVAEEEERHSEAPIFDVDEEEESLTRAEAGAGLDADDRETPPEYILEIDEELELEVDEFEREDADDEDDDDRER